MMYKDNQQEYIIDLDEALLESKKYAKRGYKLANNAISLLKGTVVNVSSKLEENIIALEQGNINDQNIRKRLSEQLFSIKQNFEEMPRQRTKSYGRVY